MRHFAEQIRDPHGSVLVSGEWWVVSEALVAEWRIMVQITNCLMLLETPMMEFLRFPLVISGESPRRIILA